FSVSFFDVLKNFFKKLFNKDKIKKISEMNVHHDKEERKVLNSNDHERYVESLRNEYFESSKNYKKDYKNLKFVKEVYVEPNPYDGTGFKKNANH
ncbi:MAG: hypothetical protein HXK68_03695, partial [Clostridiales bacterium]|nr:hypothetical protein [Clostridiales bacterium]